MKLKKTAALVLAAIMSLSAGCSSGDSSSGSGSSATEVSTPDESSKPDEPIIETVGDLDYSDYQPEIGVAADFSYSVEAEECTLGDGLTVLSDDAYGEYSGTGYVGGLSANGSLSFVFESETNGRYDVVIKAARDSESAAALYKLNVDNGAVNQSFNVSKGEDFAEITVRNVYIEQGTHAVMIKDNAGSLFIDSIEIKASSGVDLSIYDVSHKLSNPNANETTQRLYNFLVDIYGKYTLTGQYAEKNAYPLDNQLLYDQNRAFYEIKKWCGDEPAILGLDLIEYSPSRVAHGSSDGEMYLTSAKAWNEEGGIVTICWHWNAPEDYLGLNGEPWYRGFYADATSFDLKAALDGTDPAGKDLLIRDIDAIAVELQKLEDEDIPVLWRPLHEAGGDYKWNNYWFWWGASGAAAYKELWTLMYDRLTNHWGLDNLIWVWNGQRTDWYPGDEYVDIIGMDIYADANDYTSQEERFEYIRASTSTNKIIALTENGVVFDVDSAFDSGSARWSWFATWSGDYAVKDGQLSEMYTAKDQWIKTFQSERALTLHELPDWRSYPLAYED